MAVMRRLKLDYQRPPEQPRRAAGWALLIAGLGLLTEAGVSYDRLQSEREALNRETHFTGLRLDASRTHVDSRPLTEKDYEAARQIMNRLSAPWEALFASLESIKIPNVAILAIEPEVETGQVRIAGEGKDYAAVLTLVAQLRTKKAFSEVFLQQHETKRDDPQRPVSFTVSMRWGKPS